MFFFQILALLLTPDRIPDRKRSAFEPVAA
jgi:hypothetical protein